MIGEADFLGIGFFGWVDMLMSVPKPLMLERRVESAKRVRQISAYLRMKTWTSICRNTRFTCRLTDDREDFFDSILESYLPRRRFCISVKLIRSLLTSALLSMPGRITPCIDAATAEPTKQSNQWLSGCSGRCFHSSTLRPRASVLMKYSEVRCSPSMRCVSAFVPKSERQPLSPIETRSRALINDFHQLVWDFEKRSTLASPGNRLHHPGHRKVTNGNQTRWLTPAGLYISTQ